MKWFKVDKDFMTRVIFAVVVLFIAIIMFSCNGCSTVDTPVVEQETVVEPTPVEPAPVEVIEEVVEPAPVKVSFIGATLKLVVGLAPIYAIFYPIRLLIQTRYRQQHLLYLKSFLICHY